jgi:hypothetical protein
MAGTTSEVPTKFHAGGTQSWVSGGETLALFRQLVKPGDRTVETGSGASTVTFAELGAVHTAISPFSDEHERIRTHCAFSGINTTNVEFIAESSDIALPRLVMRGDKVDLVYIDGKHAFPFPTIDFHYANLLLRAGGILVMDDAPIRAVKQVCRFLKESPEWEYLGCTNDRALAYRKIDEAPDEDNWHEQPMNSLYPDFWYLTMPRRLYLSARAVGSYVKRRVL